MKKFFELIHTDKKTGARAGIIHTAHGDIETPCFMPVGTQAGVKALDQKDLLNLNTPIILSNTYHLHLRPGEDLIYKMGGLHKFMNWPKPILTDSGGFQVFSLGKQKETKEIKNNNKHNKKLVKITEEGVTFYSHLDGSKHFFSPEKAIEIQHKIGADIIMAFDECTPDEAPYEYALNAMERTHNWAKQCLEAHQKFSAQKIQPYPQFLFGIIQGGKHQVLREQSAKFITNLDFSGIAIGGESIGYNMEITENILSWLKNILPENKPRYTMGVGLNPADLLKVVSLGVDMFDCVAPTRLARHGMLFTNEEKIKRINITNASFADDSNPIDKNCSCLTCQKYSRSYLHHLFIAQEITAMRLASLHNIHFMLELMRQTRQAILEDNFANFLKNNL